MPTTKEFGPERLVRRLGVSRTARDALRRFVESQPRKPLQAERESGTPTTPGQAGRQPAPVQHRLARAGRHGGRRGLSDCSSVDAGVKYRGHLPADRDLQALDRRLRRGRPAAGQPIDDNGFYVQGAFYPDQEEARALRRDLVDLRRQGRRLRHQPRVHPGRELLSRSTPATSGSNAQVIEVDRSPASSLFGFYVGGQKGTTGVDRRSRSSSEGTRCIWCDVLIGRLADHACVLCRARRRASAPQTPYVVNDSHLPPDQLRPGGDRHPRLPEGDGRQGGTRRALRHPAAAAVVLRQHRRLRADLLPADRRAALLLLVHRRVHRDGLPVAVAGRSGRGSIR